MDSSIARITSLTAMLSGTLCGILYITDWQIVHGIPQINATTGILGEILLTTYALPFEVASVLLLVAMVGVVLLSKKDLG
jgi:NADH:ubiquinone oxidoreductase subunit 6 (subunit J)